MDNAKHYDDAAIALIDARCKSNTHRINELQEHQTALDRLATSVEVLATKQETVEGDVKEIKEDVKAITGKVVTMARAAELRPMIEQAAKSFTDADAAKSPELVARWTDHIG